MANIWTDLPDGDVDVDSPVNVALMTALRDNPGGLAQRSNNAPKIFGVAYDFQEFTASGTWTKPSAAESGDIVVVQVVGGGESGSLTGAPVNGGGGGGGIIHTFQDIDDLGATETVAVGSGGTGNLGNGGDSSFGTADEAAYLFAEGGGSGGSGEGGRAWGGGLQITSDTVDYPSGGIDHFNGGAGGDTGGTIYGQNSIYGGAGGGVMTGSAVAGGVSALAGNGGASSATSGTYVDGDFDGEFPGGGGGAVDTSTTGPTRSGTGGDGVVRVWCIKEE